MLLMALVKFFLGIFDLKLWIWMIQLTIGYLNTLFSAKNDACKKNLIINFIASSGRKEDKTNIHV